MTCCRKWAASPGVAKLAIPQIQRPVGHEHTSQSCHVTPTVLTRNEEHCHMSKNVHITDKSLSFILPGVYHSTSVKSAVFFFKFTFSIKWIKIAIRNSALRMCINSRWDKTRPGHVYFAFAVKWLVCLTTIYQIRQIGKMSKEEVVA